MIDDWISIIRREAQYVFELAEKKSTLVATGYNPDTHSVKGILVPSGVETGWVPIATHGIGNGWGFVTGPKVGDDKKLDGDQFDVEFEFGDPNTPVARHRVYSSSDKPPRVESGETMIRHEKGQRLLWDKDGNLKAYGSKSDNQHIFWNSDGSVEIKEDGGSSIKMNGDIVTVDCNKFHITRASEVLLEDGADKPVEGGIAGSDFYSTKVKIKGVDVAT